MIIACAKFPRNLSTKSRDIESHEISVGGRRHEQIRKTCPHLEYVFVHFTAERSVDELFMHFFHNLSSVGALSMNPTGGLIPDP